MTAKGIIIVLATLLVLPRSAAAQAGEQVLSAGDSILIAVHQNPDLSGVFGVRADGTIGSPFYSSVNVEGVPIPEVESRVREYLSVYEQQNPRVIVDPFFLVTVAGEVRQPGVYGLGVGGTMMQAVLRAGGVSDRGALNRVVLYRDGQSYGLNLTRPDPTMGGMMIRSGDQLVVRPRQDIFRNYVLPLATIAGATAAIINAVDRRR